MTPPPLTAGPDTVRRNTGIPVYRQVAALVSASIDEGRLRADDQLPSEGELARRYGVSRLTVRQALADLVREGRIRTVHGKGSFVARPPLRYVVSAAREASLTRAMAGRGHHVAQRPLHASIGTWPAMQRRLETRGQVLRIQQVRSVGEGPWSVTSTWVASSRFRCLAERWRGEASLYDVLAEQYGVRMRGRNRSFAAVPANGADALHLVVAIGSARARRRRAQRRRRRPPGCLRRAPLPR